MNIRLLDVLLEMGGMPGGFILGGIEPLPAHIWWQDYLEFIPDDLWDKGCIVELGSHVGGSTIRLARMAQKNHLKPVVAVDTWSTEWCDDTIQTDKYYEEFLKNIKKERLENNVRIIRDTTVNAAREWEDPICFLLIDADHRAKAVKLDIQAWCPHVISGGLILMHDFLLEGDLLPNDAGPREAAEELILPFPEQYEFICHRSSGALFRKV